MTSTSITGPVVSVVICTHNRADDLGRALGSVLAQPYPPEQFEVVVVDNRSTDETRAVVEQHAASGPVRGIREETLGLCHARNSGWRAARSAIVAYLDDDALACEGWLDAVVSAFDAGGPALGCVGGRVDPIWEAPRPGWLSDQLSLGLTIIDWSAEARPITDVRSEWLVGTNLAFRREALEAVGGFDPALDRAGSRMLSSGDTYLVEQVLRRGFRCLYDPRMRVRHRVPASRLTKGWFRRRYFWQGVSDAVIELLDTSPPASARLLGAWRRTRRLLAAGDLRRLLRNSDDPARFEQTCWSWIAVGHIAGLLGAARR